MIKKLMFLFFIFLFFPSESHGKNYCIRWIAVRSGDSCWEISRNLGTSVEKLKKMNTGVICEQLWVGEKLCTATSTAKPSCTRFHQVSSGDNCFVIRTKYDLSERELMEMNENLSCERIQIGQSVCTSVDQKHKNMDPPKTTPPAPRSTESSHGRDQFCTQWMSVGSGDMCWKISDRLKTTVDDLIKMNPGLNCDQLWAGDKLCTATSPTRPSCTRHYKVSKDDTCFIIWNQAGLSEPEFMNLNPKLNCGGIQIGQSLCTSVDPTHKNKDPPKTAPSVPSTTVPSSSTTTLVPSLTSASTVTPTNAAVASSKNVSEHSPLPMVEGFVNCSEFTIVDNGTTCFSIALAYHLNLTKLTQDYDCNHLLVGDTICVSHNYTCQHRYMVRENDTCHSIGIPFKLQRFELEAINEDVKCENLEIGRKLCVVSIHERSLKNVTCSVEIVLDEDSTCFNVAYNYSISVDEFQFLNPTLSCGSSILKGSLICVSSASTVANCSSILPVPSNSTCAELASSNSMSVSLLMKLNPVLNCQKLNVTSQYCSGVGYYDSRKCTDSLRLTPEIDTCEKIQNRTGLLLEQIEDLNPYLNCTDSLKWSKLVCIASLGMDTQTVQSVIIAKLQDLVPGLLNKYHEYQTNPSQENSEIMYTLMMSSLLKPSVNSRMKVLYRDDLTIRQILDSQHPLPRETYCDQTKAMTMWNQIKDCFCGDDQLLVYCQALLTQKLQEKQEFHNETAQHRSKRGIGCKIAPFGSLTRKTEMLAHLANNCWGGDCSLPVGFFELSVIGEFCTPLLSTVDRDRQYKICLEQRKACETVNPDDSKKLKSLADRSITGKIQICLIAHEIMDILNTLGFGGCFEIVAADYFPLVGKLTVGSSLTVAGNTLAGGANVKVHNMLIPKMCRDRDLECEDYCMWGDWDNGRAYGYIKITLFNALGWKGWTPLDKQFNEPSRVGCDEGEKAAVLLRNERTCEDENERDTWRCCWSTPPGECTFEIMDIQRGFQFVPNIIGNTLFTCEFFDRHAENIGEKVGFDVYGGTSHNQGKKNFYYVAKNDGMYFGTVKYEENRRVAEWAHPCKAAPEEVPSETEPSGRSEVPAAACGKRVVGYYTGWGNREITEDQLRKLTHVIFAFVAMKEDGSLEFGPVSMEHDSLFPRMKPMRRFFEMREKARAVFSGVHIQFAIGGWDNSQYFSSVLRDSKKRKVFIESIASFIETTKIDGVDIDWEYPDSQGAEKAILVTFLRELRLKLDQTQKANYRTSGYLISLATAAGEWDLQHGYDLNGILKYADYLNVMTYDYYGAWDSQWGAFTGPPAPLHFGGTPGSSGKLNVDYTMKYYSCKTKKKQELTMGVPFYGRYWKNVLGPIDGKDGMWRTAQNVSTKFEGGFVAWRNLEEEGWNKRAAIWHEKTGTPYIFNSAARMFLGFENEQSIAEKMRYAYAHAFGGVMIWAIDLDDDSDTLLSLVSNVNFCYVTRKAKYNCNPIDEVRWWTLDNSNSSVNGHCGKSAKLINGYYPVCDPDDAYHCCSSEGHCGSTKEHCDCEKCVNYRKHPLLILQEPIKPTRSIQWYVNSDGDGKAGRCGKDVPLLNGKIAICNPDNDSKHCCSNGGYCGTGKEYCECDGCVDYRKTK